MKLHFGINLDPNFHLLEVHVGSDVLMYYWPEPILALNTVFTHIRLTSFLWDIGKQAKPRSGATEPGV